MKKMYTLLVMVVLSVHAQISSAQNGSPYWSLAGNSNATTSSKLGTTNNVPLRLFTNNVERLRIDGTGKVGIATTNPKGQLSIQSSGGVPASLWVTSGVPIFAGFGENTPGNADDILGMASNTPSARAVFLGRKSRGTLALPTAVQNNDYLLSLYSSGYDGGGTFQAPASVDFIVDGTVTSGHVPTRISLSTGSGFSDRKERLKVGNSGDFNFNDGQMLLQQSTGNVGIGVAPTSAIRLNVMPPGTNTGVYSSGYTAYEANGNLGGAYGVYAHCSAGSGTGVLGTSSDYIGVYGSGKYGIYGSSGTYAGYFSGNVYASGTYTGSDAKLKQHITDMTAALDIIARLKPKTYDFRQDGIYKQMNLPTGQHYGLIAQDLEQVIPGAVKDTKFEPPSDPADHGKQTATARESVDFKAVNYTELIPILVKAVQELTAQNHQQDSTINALQQQIDQLSGGTTIDVKGFLGNNQPNPTTQSTTVPYRVPATARQAHLTLVDQMGRLVQDLRISGSGMARISTAGLAAGIYHYSLVIDDVVADTKQMVIAR